MKKNLSLMILTIMLCVLVVQSTKVDASENASLTTKSSFEIEVNTEDNLNIVDNYDDLTVNENEISIYYNLDNIENIKSISKLDYHAVVMYESNGVINKHTLSSTTTDLTILSNEIKLFINEKIVEINNISSEDQPVACLNSTNPSFSALYSGSHREVNKPFGYIDMDYTVQKYRANDISSLYLLEGNVSFVPGQIAQDLGDNSYDDYENKAGIVKVMAERAKNEVGYNQVRRGGTPIFKDAYPVNIPGQVVISSSYNIGVNLGYSYTNGFSLDNVSVENNTSVGVSIDYGYSKTYTKVEPALSTQKDPIEKDKYTWMYKYDKDHVNETYHINIGYMFEMNNFNHDLLEGDLALLFDYEFTVKENHFFFPKTRTITNNRYINYY